MLAVIQWQYSVGRGVCSSLESKPREARVKVLGVVVGKLVLPSSWVVLVASSVLPNLVANMVTNLMANMVTHLMTSMVAGVMTLRVGWSRVDGGGGLHRHMLGGQRCRGGCEKSGENK